MSWSGSPQDERVVDHGCHDGHRVPSGPDARPIRRPRFRLIAACGGAKIFGCPKRTVCPVVPRIFASISSSFRRSLRACPRPRA